MEIDKYIASRLAEREMTESMRRLKKDKNLIDFCSNDYLGFAKSPELRKLINDEAAKYPFGISGSTGSRLVSGNDTYTEDLENEIASFHGAESALIFNSGYDANLGLFSCLPKRGDTIITDELIHASIIDGARLGFATRYSFKHNDLNSLEEKLKAAKGTIFIAVESIYSMDGDTAPLIEIADLAEQYSAVLIVDEAHALGIFAEKGEGLVHQLGLQNKVFARLVTFGKALGCHGAAVLGSDALRNYLINFARSFIYTTAASPFTHLSVKMAYQLLKEQNAHEIHQRIGLFKAEAGEFYERFIDSASPIQCLIVPGNAKVKSMEAKLVEAGFNVRAILHPTVPEGKERLRICLHSFNSDEEIKNLVHLLKVVLP